MKRVECVLSFLIVTSVAPHAEQSLIFEPRVGTSLEKEVALEVEMRVTSLALDEQELDPKFLPTLGLFTSAEFTDNFERAERGRPLEYVRSFGKLDGEWEYEGTRTDILGFFALSGCAVRFEWDPKWQTYSIRRERGPCILLPIDRLVEDMDLRGLLPEEPVKLGAEWTVKGRSLADALFGGTEMGLIGISKDQVFESLVRDILLRPFRELAERQMYLQCKYVESSEPRDSRLARISLRHADTYFLEVTDAVNQCLREWGEWKVEVSDFFVRWKVDGDGALVWNVTEGHHDSLGFEAKFDLEIAFDLDFGNVRPMKIRLGVEGKAKWRMSAQQD